MDMLACLFTFVRLRPQLQVGEHEVVLEAGRKALEKWEARAFRRDILYAMSLAHLGLASEALRAKEQACVPALLLDKHE